MMAIPHVVAVAIPIAVPVARMLRRRRGSASSSEDYFRCELGFHQFRTFEKTLSVIAPINISARDLTRSDRSAGIRMDVLGRNSIDLGARSPVDEKR